MPAYDGHTSGALPTGRNGPRAARERAVDRALDVELRELLAAVRAEAWSLYDDA